MSVLNNRWLCNYFYTWYLFL